MRTKFLSLTEKRQNLRMNFRHLQVWTHTAQDGKRIPSAKSKSAQAVLNKTKGIIRVTGAHLTMLLPSWLRTLSQNSHLKLGHFCWFSALCHPCTWPISCHVLYFHLLSLVHHLPSTLTDDGWLRTPWSLTAFYHRLSTCSPACLFLSTQFIFHKGIKVIFWDSNLLASPFACLQMFSSLWHPIVQALSSTFYSVVVNDLSGLLWILSLFTSNPGNISFPKYGLGSFSPPGPSSGCLPLPSVLSSLS